MGLTGVLKKVSEKTCPHCNKPYADYNGMKGHSKKQFIKCLYTANHNLYNAILEIDRLKSKKESETDG